ncbi:hypothetical protein [Kribbella sp. CA-247076]|uniref:hypothetical protein n=1 Tax=Kribbella sp. CA-247076 TaxID=3239941 RepID=UPI003D917CE5
MTESTYQVEVSYHQFLLVVGDASPILDLSTAGPVLALDPEIPTAVIIRTGCADGPVNVTVRVRDEPLPDLATASDHWEIGEQIAIPIGVRSTSPR